MLRLGLLVFPTALLLVPLVCAAPVPVAPKTDDPPSASAVLLLEHRKVQKELKMTAEHRIAIVDGLADLEEEYDKKWRALERKPEAPEEAFDKLDKEHGQRARTFLNDAAARSLTATQRKRLGQLDFHVRRVVAFTDRKVAKLLQLTDAQKKKATELAEGQKGAAGRFFGTPTNEDDAKR